MIEPGINMQANYPQDPDNYTISSSWHDYFDISLGMLKLKNVLNKAKQRTQLSPDAARLIMDNTLIIRQLLDIMTRTMKSQLR